MSRAIRWTMLNLLALGGVLHLVGSASAVDIITRKGEAKRLAGAIDSISKTEVVIKTGLNKDMPKTVPVNAIERIQWDGEPATLNGHRNQEAAGSLKQALAGYQKILNGGNITNDNLKTDLEYMVARVTGKMALADPGKIDDAVGRLEAFRRSHPNSYRHYDLLSLLGDLHLAAQAYDKAAEVYGELQQAPWKATQLSAKNSEARVLLAQGNTAEALTAYEAVLREVGNDPNLKTLNNQALLGKAACLQTQGQHDETLKVLDDVIASADVADSSVMAEAYLLRGDSYRELNRNKDALLAYLHVDVLFAGETKYHPKALFHLARLWQIVDQPGRAKDAKSRLQTDYPNSQWAKQL